MRRYLTVSGVIVAFLIGVAGCREQGTTLPDNPKVAPKQAPGASSGVSSAPKMEPPPK